MAPGRRRARLAATTHDPIAVIDDQRTDEHDQAVAWLWHIECYTCGQPLPDVRLDQLRQTVR